MRLRAKRVARLGAVGSFMVATVFGGLAHAQSASEGGPAISWLPRFQQALRGTWINPRISTSGDVRIVVGNDLELPGRQFGRDREWMALACVDGLCQLVPADLSVTQARPDARARAADRTAQHLHFRSVAPAGSEVVAWFQRSAAQAWIAPGVVPTYHHRGQGRPAEAGAGTEEALIRLPGGGSAALVPMMLAPPSPEESLPPLTLLQLRSGGARQLLLGLLGRCTGEFSSERYVLWVGDLDRDGRPDYLIGFGEIGGPVHLYLSGDAKAGELVRLAGIYNGPESHHHCRSAVSPGPADDQAPARRSSAVFSCPAGKPCTSKAVGAVFRSVDS
jgi:hypothetical protein